MIEAKKLAYADMLRYVGEPQGARIPVETLLEQGARRAAREADRSREGRLRGRAGAP